MTCLAFIRHSRVHGGPTRRKHHQRVLPLRVDRAPCLADDGERLPRARRPCCRATSLRRRRHNTSSAPKRLLLERVSYWMSVVFALACSRGDPSDGSRPLRLLSEIDDRQRACITSRRCSRWPLGRFRRRRWRGERHGQIQGDALHHDVALERDVVLVLEAHAMPPGFIDEARSSGRRGRPSRALDGGGDLPPPIGAPPFSSVTAIVTVTAAAAGRRFTGG